MSIVAPESLFPWGQIHTATSTVGETSLTFSLCEQHSVEVGVLAGVAVSKAVQTICSHGSKPSSNQDQSTGGARVAFVRGCINQFDIRVVQRACREGLAFQRGLLPRALCEERKTIIEFSRRLVSPFDIHRITRLAFS